MQPLFFKVYYLIFCYFHPHLCQLFNSTTVPLSRFGGKILSTTPVFQEDFQRIEGLASAKEVSHGPELVITGWWPKTRAI